MYQNLTDQRYEAGAIGVVALLGPSVPNLILTIAVLYAPRFARVAYASTIAVRGLDFVLAEHALGAPDADWVVTSFAPSVPDAARVHKAGRRLLAAPPISGYDPDLCARRHRVRPYLWKR